MDQTPMNLTMDDCPQFFAQEPCTRGKYCKQRHQPLAIHAKSTCKFWKETTCIKDRCRFRHVAEFELPCEFEKLDSRCKNPNCLYKHAGPRGRNISGGDGRASGGAHGYAKRGAMGGPSGAASGSRAGGASEEAQAPLSSINDFLVNFNLELLCDKFVCFKNDLAVFLTLTEEDIETQMPSIDFADRRRLVVAINKYKLFLVESGQGRGARPKQSQVNPARSNGAREPPRSDGVNGAGGFPRSDGVNGARARDQHRSGSVNGVRSQLRADEVNGAVNAPTVSRTNLYVKLDPEITENRLRKEFELFGIINHCKIMRDANGVSKGYAFIHYETEAAATTAIHKMDGRILYPHPQRLHVTHQLINDRRAHQGNPRQDVPRLDLTDGPRRNKRAASANRNKSKLPSPPLNMQPMHAALTLPAATHSGIEKNPAGPDLQMFLIRYFDAQEGLGNKMNQAMSLPNHATENTVQMGTLSKPQQPPTQTAGEPRATKCARCPDPPDVRLEPCGHVCLCEDCSAIVRVLRNKCPICFRGIDDVKAV